MSKEKKKIHMDNPKTKQLIQQVGRETPNFLSGLVIHELNLFSKKWNESIKDRLRG